MDLRTAVELACIVEATVAKPGNVHPGHSYQDLNYLDLVRCALVIGPILANAKRVGPAVLESVQACRRVRQSNANLGIILLLAPLCVSAPGGPDASNRDLKDWQANLVRMLQATTIEDAQLVYEAIRLANPGGLGSTLNQDVQQPPSVPLIEAMELAKDRDGIAHEWSTGFSRVFTSLQVFSDFLNQTKSIQKSALLTFLSWMSSVPHDTLILRKRGQKEYEESARRAIEALAAWCGWNNKDFTHEVQTLDAWCREFGNQRNPGTSADLTAATLFLALAHGRLDNQNLAF